MAFSSLLVCLEVLEKTEAEIEQMFIKCGHFNVISTKLQVIFHCLVLLATEGSNCIAKYFVWYMSISCSLVLLLVFMYGAINNPNVRKKINNPNVRKKILCTI